jgi:hypothetical protein
MVSPYVRGDGDTVPPTGTVAAASFDHDSNTHIPGRSIRRVVATVLAMSIGLRQPSNLFSSVIQRQN